MRPVEPILHYCNTPLLPRYGGPAPSLLRLCGVNHPPSMRVYISADIEASPASSPGRSVLALTHDFYDFGFARRMMTHDVNAAIRGARAAGAIEVVVKDSHGVMKNLLIEEFEPGHPARLRQRFRDDGRDDAGHRRREVRRRRPRWLSRQGGHRAGDHGAHVHGRRPSRVLQRARDRRDGPEHGSCRAVWECPPLPSHRTRPALRKRRTSSPALPPRSVKTGFGRYSGQLLHPSETGPLIEASRELRGIRARAELPKVAYPGPLTLIDRIQSNRGSRPVRTVSRH